MPRLAAGPPFVPLGWDGADRPIEIGRITRVRMPTALAVRFGWPLLPDAPDARVAADVLVGEDGTARALRFLPATFTPVAHPRRPMSRTAPTLRFPPVVATHHPCSPSPDSAKCRPPQPRAPSFPTATAPFPIPSAKGARQK